MGMYASVRGWIELDHKQRPDAERILEQHQDGFYSGGWGWPEKPFNWTLYLFYGGDIREAAVPEFRGQIERLASLAPRNEDEDWPRGLFVVTDERGHVETWQVREGAIIISPAPEFGWLG